MRHHTSMFTKLMVLMAALTLVLAACGNDDTDVATPGAGGDGVTAEPVCISENEELLPEYVGLSEDAAQELADEQGLSYREVGRDGECAVITMDLRDDRVNVEFADDVVIAAAIF